MKVIYILFGGALGALSRYTVSGAFQRFLRFPIGTFVVNALGCFLIGFLFSVLDESIPFHPEFKHFLLIGFLGAFTTFSTFALETLTLLRDGNVYSALLNIFIQVAVGLFLVYMGMASAQIITG